MVIIMSNKIYFTLFKSDFDDFVIYKITFFVFKSLIFFFVLYILCFLYAFFGVGLVCP